VSATLDRGRLLAWGTAVSLLTLIAYASRAAGGKPPKDAAYQYSTASGGIVQYALILGVVLVIARPRWELLALRRPAPLRRAISTGVLVYVTVLIVAYVVDQFSDPGREQGLTPDRWEPSRATPFVVNFVVFVAVAPAVEELTFRGLGYSLLAPLGPTAAILWVGLAFGLAHGLLEGLPILIAFGAGLALLRARTDSVYPGIVLHAAFNAIALIGSVSGWG
jgi:CAAX protease family protein